MGVDNKHALGDYWSTDACLYNVFVSDTMFENKLKQFPERINEESSNIVKIEDLKRQLTYIKMNHECNAQKSCYQKPFFWSCTKSFRH